MNDTRNAAALTYEEFEKEAGKGFAEETRRMAELHAAGEINDWETIDLGLGHSRNGKSHTSIERESSLEAQAGLAV